MRLLALLIPVVLLTPALAFSQDEASRETAPSADGSVESYENLTEPVIPPGQEELLAAMLGKGSSLPDDCKLTAGRVEQTLVTATYDCGNGEIVYQLLHPSRATNESVKTEQFVIALRSGTPPASLSPALVGLVRARESEFRWRMPNEGGSRRAWLGAGIALVIFALWAISRRRRGSSAS